MNGDMDKEKSCCIVDSWFSNARRMGLAALVSAVLGIFSVFLHYVLASVFGKNELASGIAMIMAFVFLAGFSVAFALWLILCLERRLRPSACERNFSKDGTRARMSSKSLPKTSS